LSQEREKFFSRCEFQAKAPGSFFWVGEHAVMYGQLAIMQSIRLYAWVGLELGNFDNFEFDVRVLHEKTNIPTSFDNHFRLNKIKEWINKEHVETFLIGWKKESNFDQFFKVNIWCEIPPRCGLNSSGAIGSALAALLYKLEHNVEYKDLMSQFQEWRSKDLFELKKDDVFLDIFAKAWMFDDCCHDFSSSGAGPFSSMVGHSEVKNLLLFFTEAKGFNSLHKIKRKDNNYTSALQEIKRINFWSDRIELSGGIEKELQIIVIFSGKPKGTGFVLEQLEDWFNIPVESFQDLLPSALYDDKFKYERLAKPISNLLRKYLTIPTDSEYFSKTIFMQSLGLLSWVMLKAIKDGDLKYFLSTVHCINNFHIFYNIFLGSLISCKVFIEDQIVDYQREDPKSKCAIKPTGAGGGGDLVAFMRWNDAVKFEHDINKKAEKGEEKYQIHYSTETLGWKVEGLELIKEKRKTGSIGDDVLLKSKISEETIRIDFLETEILVNGESINKNYPFLLTEYIILKDKKVHWLWAYVILEKFKVKEPKVQFKKYIYKKKKDLAKCGIHITPLKGKVDNFAEFKYFEDTVVSNIKDIKNDYRQALVLNGNNKTLQAIQQLTSLATNEENSWYIFTDAYIDLVRWVYKLGFKDVERKVIDSCKKFLQWYAFRLKSGISRIEAYKKYEELDHESDDEFKAIKDELIETEELLPAFVQMLPPEPEDLEYQELKKTLISTQEKLLVIQQSLEYQQSEDGCELDALKILIDKENAEDAMLSVVKDLEHKIKPLAEVMEYGRDLIYRKLKKNGILKRLSQTEVEGRLKTIYGHIALIIIELDNFAKFDQEVRKLGALKNYFYNKLSESLK
jgi:mevalonate kinase